MAENAQTIAEVARELYARAAKFGEELSSVGRGLTTALDAYDRAVGSFDRRLVPMAKQLEEMKLAEGSRRALEAPELVVRRPREIQSDP
jgi:DNA recombination protein RmuC